MSTYKYTPLEAETGEIRLIQLHAGSFEDPIRISIITVPFDPQPLESPEGNHLEQARRNLPIGWTVHETLEGRIIFYNKPEERTAWDHPDPSYDWRPPETDAHWSSMPPPEYEALSYRWGSDDAKESIEIVPMRRRSPSLRRIVKRTAQISVRQNLHHALKHLRTPNTPRILWIDAICINQNDKVERGQQVNLMGDIFKHAQRVVVWLGLPSPDSALALRVLGHLGCQVEFTKDYHLLPAQDITERDWWESGAASGIDNEPETWKAIFDLLVRPWFDRVWVVQEIQLANPNALIQCGNDTILWRHLRRALIVCDDMTFPEERSSSLKVRFRNLFSIASDCRSQDPVALLRNAINAECSDPRDKIYALLGLLPGVLSREIQPRYENSAQAVHRDAFMAYVEVTARLDILTLVGPSWMPNWTGVWRTVFGTKGYYCSSKSAAEASYVAPNVLMASGVLYDTIDAVVGPLPDDKSKILSLIKDLWLTGNHIYPSGESLAQACAWTLWNGHLADRWPTDRSAYRGLAEAQLPFQEVEQGGLPSNYESAWPYNLTGDTLFKTTKGYFGISGTRAAPGDKVSVLLGCPLPTLLRARPDEKYLFIGCTYVHGIMDGEALLGPLREDYTVIVYPNEYGVAEQQFLHSENQERLFEDPRLGSLPPEWQPIHTKHRLWPTKEVDAFKNIDTGQILDSDPRLLPDALRARGVRVETLALV